MVFAISVAVVSVAAAAGASIGGMALGLAVSLRERMKRTATPVTHIMNLTEGDHISVKKRGDLPFRHAVVVEPVRDQKDKVRLVYHSGSNSGARVEYTEVDLHKQATHGELYRHGYEAIICYPGPAVVARAISLCSQYNSSDRREIIRNYWSFFRDDEHFANWCQIGFSFADGMKSAILADYTRTLISDVARLNEGDHIMTEDGLSAIVVRIGEKMAQLEVAQFPSDDKRGPGLVVISDVARVYRVDYDVAVGVSGHEAKDTALSETTQPTEPMPYNSADEFAVWCKTLLKPIDWKVASALAAARLTGRVWTWVHAVDELRPGDHIAFNSGLVYYYQHAIVSRVEGRRVSIIYLVGNVADVTRKVVQHDALYVSRYVRAQKLCKYFYDVREWYDPDTVIARATDVIGSAADKLPYKDPQHFATWCKTGSYQLHC